VRAINLLPADQRRGGGGGLGGRSGGMVYALLGLLAVVVIAAAAYVMVGNQITDRRSELVRVKAESDALVATAGALQPYSDFDSLKQARVATVASLAQSRFNWERVLQELSRVIPTDVSLVTLTGTVAPGVQVGGTGSAGQLRQSLAVPAIELAGCTRSHSAVARMMGRMRLIDGVSRVTLSSSQKVKGAAAPTAGSTGPNTSADCRSGKAQIPLFNLVIFFEGLVPATPSAAAPASTPAAAPAGAATQAAGQTTTASTTPGSTK